MAVGTGFLKFRIKVIFSLMVGPLPSPSLNGTIKKELFLIAAPPLLLVALLVWTVSFLFSLDKDDK